MFCTVDIFFEVIKKSCVKLHLTVPTNVLQPKLAIFTSKRTYTAELT